MNFMNKRQLKISNKEKLQYVLYVFKDEFLIDTSKLHPQYALRNSTNESFVMHYSYDRKSMAYTNNLSFPINSKSVNYS